MRKENGLFILKETREEQQKIGFQGIILDTSRSKEQIRISRGKTNYFTGEYQKSNIDTIYVKQRLQIQKLKKCIQEFLELKHPEEVEMGFPELAITERLEKLLVNR